MKTLKITFKQFALLMLVLILIGSSCTQMNKIAGVNSSNDWNSSDTPGHNYASFKELNGTQKFDLKLAPQSSSVIYYHVIVSQGRLTMEVKSPSGSVLKKEVTASLKDSLIVNSQNNNERYSLFITGEHASGVFDVTYKP